MSVTKHFNVGRENAINNHEIGVNICEVIIVVVRISLVGIYVYI